MASHAICSLPGLDLKAVHPKKWQSYLFPTCEVTSHVDMFQLVPSGNIILPIGEKGDIFLAYLGERIEGIS